MNLHPRLLPGLYEISLDCDPNQIFLTMDFDVLEKLLNHLERCQLENKPLEINIDGDLLKINSRSSF